MGVRRKLETASEPRIGRISHMSRIGVLSLLVALIAGSGHAGAKADSPFVVRQKSFTSSGRKVLVDVYRPTAAGRHTPILVLHGAGGMLFDGPEMSRVAAQLARAGFEAYQVHYFDRTHTWYARQAVLLKLFPTWRATVGDAVKWVHAQRPEAPKVGIFGYSLGAFAAIETARRDPSIGAIVEEAGGFWHGHPEGPTQQPLPPMLVIHGTADTRVPNEKYTQPLLEYLLAHDDPYEQRFYPGEGHELSTKAAAKVRKEAVEFFARHLP
ncbi:MAG: dienelactone hydrolase family protein [Chthoniobacterales bacterium]|nr:dienelactone hydrolase family protein [Chthoniobacterales bacterium]